MLRKGGAFGGTMKSSDMVPEPLLDCFMGVIVTLITSDE